MTQGDFGSPSFFYSHCKTAQQNRFDKNMFSIHSSPGAVVGWFVPLIFLFGVTNTASAGRLEPDIQNNVPTSALEKRAPVFMGQPGPRTDSNCLFSAFGWQFLPNSLVYPAYLAGVRESRLGGVWNHDKQLGWIWDATLGGCFPLLRKGYSTGPQPVGFQVDIEASAHLRLDMERSFELYSTDYRVGIPLTYGTPRWQFKTAYYHVSSHIGDEFIQRHWDDRFGDGIPTRPFQLGSFRKFYSRDAIVLGIAWRPVPEMRFYTEFDFDLGGGSVDDRKESLDVQLGAEYSAPYRPGTALTPFVATHLTFYGEKSNRTGYCLQCGFQARGTKNQLFRAGVQYYTGVGEQYQRFNYKEHKFGIGLWYDY